MSRSPSSYHHGDLRAALVRAATASLEAGEPFSMRAIARRAGVSPAAPYRHFTDRDELESALAVAGFRDLHGALAAAQSATPREALPTEEISRLALTYVDFALQRPALFRLMFGGDCDLVDGERVKATHDVQELLLAAVARRLPEAAPAATATALWGLAHGLAFLHLDGKFSPEPLAEVHQRVRASIAALLHTPTTQDSPTTQDTQSSQEMTTP